MTTTSLTAASKSTDNASREATLSAAAIHYHLDFERYTQHLVNVQITFVAQSAAPILWLPSWIPGSYLMREFARNITAVQYTISAPEQESAEQDVVIEIEDAVEEDFDIELCRGQKISKNEWQLTEVKEGDHVCVTYEVYCYDLSVRTAYVDQYRLYGNFTSLALTIEGQSQQPVQVTLSVPVRFYQDKVADKVTLACGLAATHLQMDDTHYYQLQADSYEMLIDYPFELSEQLEGTFIVHDAQQKSLVHRLFIAGKHNTDIARLQQDLATICQCYVSWLGDTPFSDYTFMTYASGNDYGGLEHINSTSLITPRRDLPTNEPVEPLEPYQRYLGLCSHEYFHAWWVKTVRPDVMMQVDLRAEAYTPLLWVFEGFTSYIDDFMLQASGVISHNSYLKLLSEQINRYTQTHGRQLQSVAESSFDAWIKLYRADENTGNAGISYYNKGALVALCLDLLLLKHSDGQYRLFDIVKAFYTLAKEQGNRRIGMTSEHLGEVVSGFIDAQIWEDFVSHYINGVDALPIFALLEANGVKVSDVKKNNTLPWGIRCEESPEGLKVSKVLRGSVAAAAGLSAKDVIVAIDGIKADKAQLQHIAETSSEQVTCHAFRRDELLTFSVPAKLTIEDEEGQSHELLANPSLEKISLSLQKSGWEAWLNVFNKQ